MLQAMTRNSAPCSRTRKLCAFDGVAGDGAARFGAVGQARGVSDEGEACPRESGQERLEDGKAAESGIEDANGGWALRGNAQGLFPSVGTASSVR